MTNSEAAQSIKEMYRIHQQACVDKDRAEAVQMAIDALERPYTQKMGEQRIDEQKYGDKEVRCSECGAIIDDFGLRWKANNYCYHCGAALSKWAKELWRRDCTNCFYARSHGRCIVQYFQPVRKCEWHECWKPKERKDLI